MIRLSSNPIAFTIIFYSILGLALLKSPVVSHADDHSHECLPCLGMRTQSRKHHAAISTSV